MFPFREVNEDAETQPELRIDTGNVMGSEIAPGSHVKRNIKRQRSREERVSEVG